MAFTLPGVPGFTQGIPFDIYLKMPGTSASQLKKMMRSPLAYKWALDHPDHTSTPALALGNAAHTAILEPHRLKTDYVLWNGGDRRGKAWLEFKDANSDRTILTTSEFADVQGMFRAVRGHAPAARYLQEGAAEITMQWTDATTGRQMRGRLDWLTRDKDGWVIVDLKTTRDSSRHKFGADAYRLGYHIQFAMYVDGFHALTGETARFVCLAVENKAPFEPAVFNVPDEVLERGHNHYQDLLATLQECESTGAWPPAMGDEQDLSLPAWAMGDMDDDDDLSGLGLQIA